jgi:hypothetical protein
LDFGLRRGRTEKGQGFVRAREDAKETSRSRVHRDYLSSLHTGRVLVFDLDPLWSAPTRSWRAFRRRRALWRWWRGRRCWYARITTLSPTQAATSVQLLARPPASFFVPYVLCYRRVDRACSRSVQRKGNAAARARAPTFPLAASEPTKLQLHRPLLLIDRRRSCDGPRNGGCSSETAAKGILNPPLAGPWAFPSHTQSVQGHTRLF